MIYTFFSILALILALPFLVLLTFKPKFRRSIPARFFLFKNSPPKTAKFHIHACSFGEVSAIEQLAKALKDTRISVITQTGFERASKFSKMVNFLPFECFLPFWLTKCETLIVFEAEMWLNLFRAAKKKGARTILLNARISDKSYRSYLRFKFYYSLVFSSVDLVLAQSQTDKIRLEKLGAKNVKIIGNIKSANTSKPTKNYPKNFQKLIIIASSHENEEKNILNNLKLPPNAQLIIAPRHPERFNEVQNLAQNFAAQNSLNFENFSKNLGLKSEIILLDKLGELINFYQNADIILLCGSFEKNLGGHNPIEAAQFGAAIISGEHFFNQKSLYDIVENIKIAKYTEISTLLAQNLPPTKIKNRANFDEILSQIKG